MVVAMVKAVGLRSRQLRGSCYGLRFDNPGSFFKLCLICPIRNKTIRETKNQWARDDPAFIVILSLFVVVATSAYCAAYDSSFGHAVFTVIGANALAQVVKWKIYDGKSIDVLGDIWILDKCLNKWPTFVSVQHCEDLAVENFIEQGCWNVEKLMTSFGIELVNLICHVRIYSNLANDEVELISFKPGKSISALITDGMPFQTEIGAFWAWLKSLKLVPRTLSECYAWLENGIDRNSFHVKLYCIVVFMTWKSRCKLIFDGSDSSCRFLAASSISMTSFVNIGMSKLGNWGANQPNRLLLKSWLPPPPDWIKVNVDASLLTSYEATVGGVFRDCKGRFLLAFSFKGLHWDVSRLEFLAIKSLGLILQDWMLEYEGVIIESDNANMISFLCKLNKDPSKILITSEFEGVDFLKEFKHDDSKRKLCGVIATDDVGSRMSGMMESWNLDQAICT
ncbi:hypothetical protein M5K25_016033 [Dendrobium thyrsiflorum]|uniref:RNase H type-1 domain-containing protein n=1 Tax=Dendrobium thyrsiflorum TaxID=117978 RepID=A0ABD0URW2_DENTH